MSAPDSIGGKVLDSSAVAAWLRGRISAVSWFAIAGEIGLVLYIPVPAVDEVRAVRPGAGTQLDELGNEPAVVLGELNDSTAAAVDELLDRAGDGVFDAVAGHVVHVARRRGWPVLTAYPARLQALDSAVEVELL